MNIKRKILCISSILISSFILASSALALEYQWKFVISELKDKNSAVAVFEVLQAVPGVEDIDINILRKSTFVFFDDELTDENKLKRHLQKAGFTVEKMQVMVEPKEGIM